jgi:hypothetical protein
MPLPALFRLLCAATLGLCCALLLACGSGGGKGLIPSSSAGPLKSDFDNIASLVASGSCKGQLDKALAQARSDLSALPATVDQRLKARLSEGLANLARRAPVECAQNTTSTASTVPSTVSTPTNTTTTQTTTTQTTTTQTTPHTTPQTTPSTPKPTPEPTPPDNGGGAPAPGPGNGNGVPGGGAGAGGAGDGGGNGQ